MICGHFNFFMRFCLDDEGATAIEYGLTACLVGVALITTLSLMGGNLADVFNKVANGLSGETPPPLMGAKSG